MAMDYPDGGGRSSKRFCGRMLTDSLALICDGQYGTIVPMDKRSGTYIFYFWYLRCYAIDELSKPNQAYGFRRFVQFQVEFNIVQKS